MSISELERARDLYPGVPDALLVERLVEELALKLELEPPTDLHRAASFQGIKDIHVAEMDWAGMLAPSESGGFIITVRRADQPHRRNFTIGHEITHTLLPGYAVIQHRCGGLGTPTLLDNRHLEKLADTGAAEWLLPRRFLRPIFADMAFDMSAIKDVADSHHASLDATSRRFLHLTNRDAVVVDLRRSVLPDGSTITTIHRVFSNSEWCPITPLQLHGKSIPSTHPINEVFGCAEAADIVNLSFLRTTTRSGHISAISDPYTDNEGRTVMRSLVLATPRRPQYAHVAGHGQLPAAG